MCLLFEQSGQFKMEDAAKMNKEKFFRIHKLCALRIIKLAITLMACGVLLGSVTFVTKENIKTKCLSSFPCEELVVKWEVFHGLWSFSSEKMVVVELKSESLFLKWAKDEQLRVIDSKDRWSYQESHRHKKTIAQIFNSEEVVIKSYRTGSSGSGDIAFCHAVRSKNKLKVVFVLYLL